MFLEVARDEKKKPREPTPMRSRPTAAALPRWAPPRRNDEDDQEREWLRAADFAAGTGGCGEDLADLLFGAGAAGAAGGSRRRTGARARIAAPGAGRRRCGPCCENYRGKGTPVRMTCPMHQSSVFHLVLFCL